MEIKKWLPVNQLSDTFVLPASSNKAELIVVDISDVKYWSRIVFCFFMTQPIEGGGTAEPGGGPDCLGPAEGGTVSCGGHCCHPLKETSLELQMLSSVTLNCQVTMIVMNSGSQLLNVNNFTQVAALATCRFRFR